jgi:hypothetical protein
MLKIPIVIMVSTLGTVALSASGQTNKSQTAHVKTEEKSLTASGVIKTNQLLTRTYTIASFETLTNNLQRLVKTGNRGASLQDVMSQYLTESGVKLSPPEGLAIYNDKIIVRAESNRMDKIEARILSSLAAPKKQTQNSD